MTIHQLWYPSRCTHFGVAKAKEQVPLTQQTKSKSRHKSKLDPATNAVHVPPFPILQQYQPEIFHSAMEFTSCQSSMNGRAQEQSLGTDAVGSNNVVSLSPLETHNTGQEYVPSCNMGDEVNSHPAINGAIGSSNDKTKFERLDDRVSPNQCIALSVSILRTYCPFRQVNIGPTLGQAFWHWVASQQMLV